jgi:hypothetical protein
MNLGLGRFHHHAHRLQRVMARLDRAIHAFLYKIKSVYPQIEIFQDHLRHDPPA